jgi:hypothetical protein
MPTKASADLTLSEMDLLRLQKALLLARMNADSTFLVDCRTSGTGESHPDHSPRCSAEDSPPEVE